MNDDESINVAELRAQVNRQIEGGVHAIFCFGTNGEGYILNGKEKELVLRTVIEECNGRVPVYAGTGCISTKETIEQSKMAQALGADVLSIITPALPPPARTSCTSTTRPWPRRWICPSSCTTSPPAPAMPLAPRPRGPAGPDRQHRGRQGLFGQLHQHPGLHRPGQEQEERHLLHPVGNDQLIIWNLLAGGTGGIAGCANVYPHVMASIYNLFMEGKIEEAKAANASIASFRACFKYGNPNTIVKTAVAMLGYNVGKCRAPFNQVPEEGIKALEKVLKENADKGMC